ncbi:MAG TPA: hypothetical protein VFD92_16810 [Candidatus Binatia bacterium]|nr:hypothetical protein [Candidatus Binatia bacterium]
MRNQVLWAAAGSLFVLALTAGCGDDRHTVVRRDTEVYRAAPPVTSSTTVIERHHDEDD